MTLKRKASVGLSAGTASGSEVRVSPHQGGLSRQSTQPATENGAAVCTPQRDNIPASALHAGCASLDDVERDRGDWLSETIEAVGSMVRYCEQLRLGSSTHILVAATFVGERSLTHFVVDNERHVIRSVLFACCITATAVCGLCRTMSSRATARPKLKKLGNEHRGGDPHSRLSQRRQESFESHCDFPREVTRHLP